jgi:hypothetical protein
VQSVETYYLDEFEETGYEYLARMHHAISGGGNDRLRCFPAANPYERFIAVATSVLERLRNSDLKPAQRDRCLALWIELQADDLMGLDGSDESGRAILYPDSVTRKSLSLRLGHSEETIRNDINALVRLGLLFCERRSTYTETGNRYERREGGIGHYPLLVRRRLDDLVVSEVESSEDEEEGVSSLGPVVSNHSGVITAIAAPQAGIQVPSTQIEGVSANAKKSSTQIESVSVSTFTDVLTDVISNVKDKNNLNSNGKTGKQARKGTSAIEPATSRQLGFIEQLAGENLGAVLFMFSVSSLEGLTKSQADEAIKTLNGTDEDGARQLRRVTETFHQEKVKREEAARKEAREAKQREDDLYLQEKIDGEVRLFGTALTEKQRWDLTKIRSKAALDPNGWWASPLREIDSGALTPSAARNCLDGLFEKYAESRRKVQ